MLFAVTTLLLGLFPSALAQFPTECNAACQPTTDFFFACSAILDPTEGIECMRTLCQSPNVESLASCIDCSAPLSATPPEVYWNMFGCAVPEPEPTPTPTPSSTSATASPTCGRPGNGNGNGNGHGNGNGNGHGNGNGNGNGHGSGNGHGHGHDRDRRAQLAGGPLRL